MESSDSFLKKAYDRIIYGNDPGFINAKYKNNLDIYLNQLLPQVLRISLFGGTFLTGIMLYMGFSDTAMAMIVLLPSILGIFSLFAGPLLERINKKKTFMMISFAIVNLFRVCVVYIPYVFARENYLTWFLIMHCTAFLINSFYAVNFNILYINSIEEGIQASFISLRSKITLFFNILFPMIMAYIIDSVPDEKRYTAFTVMFSVALASALIELLILSRLTEPKISKMEKSDITLKNIVMIPIKNKEFMGITLLSVAYYFTHFISGSFLNVFLLKYLNMSYTILTIGVTINYAIQFFVYKAGGRLIDKFGSKIPVALGILLHSFFFLFFIFAKDSNAVILYFLSYIVLSFFSPAFNVALFKYRFDSMHGHAQTYYDGFYVAAIGITILIAPILGGVIKTFIETTPSLYNSMDYAQFRLLFLISFVAMFIIGAAASIKLIGKNKKAKEI